jgi:hypothetical protein
MSAVTTKMMNGPMKGNSDASETIAIKVNTTDGKMFVFFIEDDYGKCQRVMINIGKGGYSLNAWAESLMYTVNLALTNRTPLVEIANELSNINSDKVVITGEGEEAVKIKSGPAGFVYAINKYLRYKHKPTPTAWEMPWI